MKKEPNLDNLGCIVLAAGKGKRMHSLRPKVLQGILGEPMLSHVLRCVDQIVEQRLVVIGHQARLVQGELGLGDSEVVVQKEQLGTAHAVRCAWSEVQARDWHWCLVVNGDAPLLRADLLLDLVERAKSKDAAVGFLSLEPEDPAGYGRVIRAADGAVLRVVEAKDYRATDHETDTGEVNAGVYVLNVPKVSNLLTKIDNANQQQEYYLPDLIGLALTEGHEVLASVSGAETSLLGVNNPKELTDSEQILNQRLVRSWQGLGVIIRAADQVRIGAQVQLEPGSELVGPCTLLGRTRIGPGSRVDSYCLVQDSEIGNGCRIQPFTHLEGVVLADRCQVGPYARLRPGSVLQQESKVGNFVETKKANLGPGAKASHLSYLGDCEIGAKVNIGAGTITCNYDGQDKHQTKIGDRAFIGSNTSLIAPLVIEDEALIAAGSTITKDVPAKTLAVARARQRHLAKRRKSQQDDNG